MITQVIIKRFTSQYCQFLNQFFFCIDFDCILTNLNLNKKEKNKYELTRYDLLRTENILKKAMDVEAGIDTPNLVENHTLGCKYIY